MTPTEQPIAPHEPMPHRKVIREWLVPLVVFAAWRIFNPRADAGLWDLFIWGAALSLAGAF